MTKEQAVEWLAYMLITMDFNIQFIVSPNRRYVSPMIVNRSGCVSYCGEEIALVIPHATRLKRGTKNWIGVGHEGCGYDPFFDLYYHLLRVIGHPNPIEKASRLVTIY